MSTPDQPSTPQLTRKQLRELRNTGVTPVITDAGAPDGAAKDVPAADPVAAPEAVPASEPAPVPESDSASGSATSGEPAAVRDADSEPPAQSTPDEPEAATSPSSADAPTTVIAPLPRAAEPAVVAPAPVADASVDLGTAPLTRRQARQQERIRTASVPVVTPEVMAAAGSAAASASESDPAEHAPESPAASTPPLVTEVPAAPVAAREAQSPSEDANRAVAADDVEASASSPSAPVAPAPALPTENPEHPLPDHVAAPADDALRIFEDEGGAGEPEESRATVSPSLGAGLLNGKPAGGTAASFDQLLQRDTATSGSVAGPSTLIVTQAPSGSPLVAPVAATGEVIVTGSWSLPEGMGETGHAPGTTDGKELDAALVDGELPTHSSPTPIAASAAVSTAVTPDDIITPPAPEKGNKLMLTLAITAGVLAVALIGVLVYALASGVFK